MLYTLAFSSVNTKLVFRSNPLKPSRIAALGALDRDSSREDIYFPLRQWLWHGLGWVRGEKGRGTHGIQVPKQAGVFVEDFLLEGGEGLVVLGGLGGGEVVVVGRLGGHGWRSGGFFCGNGRVESWEMLWLWWGVCAGWVWRSAWTGRSGSREVFFVMQGQFLLWGDELIG